MKWITGFTCEHKVSKDMPPNPRKTIVYYLLTDHFQDLERKNQMTTLI